MSTIDQLYDTLATVEAALAPLKITTKQTAMAWHSAVKALNLPCLPHSIRTPVLVVPDPPSPVTTADLQSLANAYLTAKVASDAAQVAVNDANLAIAAAVRAKGVGA